MWKRLRFPQRSREGLTLRKGAEMMKQAAVILFTLGIVGGVRAHEGDSLARFDGGIGVIPVSNDAGTANRRGKRRRAHSGSGGSEE